MGRPPADAPRIDKETLDRYVAKGLTRQQMVDTFEAETGARRTRAAFSLAMERFGVEPPRSRPRYEDELPWRVDSEHTMHYDARMLRLLGRQNAGKKLTMEETKRLAQWKGRLDDCNAVVHYDPRLREGFVWVPREAADEGEHIRRPDKHQD